jgi:hypothetical protein
LKQAKKAAFVYIQRILKEFNEIDIKEPTSVKVLATNIKASVGDRFGGNNVYLIEEDPIMVPIDSENNFVISSRKCNGYTKIMVQCFMDRRADIMVYYGTRPQVKYYVVDSLGNFNPHHLRALGGAKESRK